MYYDHGIEENGAPGALAYNNNNNSKLNPPNEEGLRLLS